MAKEKYLIDTNVAIDFLANRFSGGNKKKIHKIIDQIPNFSIITKIELLGFSTSESNLLILENFVNDSQIQLLSDEIVQKTIEIRRKYKIKLPDAIIAATAMVNQLTLVKRNISDFRNIDGLSLLNSHS
jgi:predicted nucleic acid-binding protein